MEMQKKAIREKGRLFMEKEKRRQVEEKRRAIEERRRKEERTKESLRMLTMMRRRELAKRSANTTTTTRVRRLRPAWRNVTEDGEEVVAAADGPDSGTRQHRAPSSGAEGRRSNGSSRSTTPRPATAPIGDKENKRLAGRTRKRRPSSSSTTSPSGRRRRLPFDEVMEGQLPGEEDGGAGVSGGVGAAAPRAREGRSRSPNRERMDKLDTLMKQLQERVEGITGGSMMTVGDAWRRSPPSSQPQQPTQRGEEDAVRRPPAGASIATGTTLIDAQAPESSIVVEREEMLIGDSFTYEADCLMNVAVEEEKEEILPLTAIQGLIDYGATAGSTIPFTSSTTRLHPRTGSPLSSSSGESFSSRLHSRSVMVPRPQEAAPASLPPPPPARPDTYQAVGSVTMGASTPSSHEERLEMDVIHDDDHDHNGFPAAAPLDVISPSEAIKATSTPPLPPLPLSDGFDDMPIHNGLPVLGDMPEENYSDDYEQDDAVLEQGEGNMASSSPSHSSGGWERFADQVKWSSIADQRLTMQEQVMRFEDGSAIEPSRLRKR